MQITTTTAFEKELDRLSIKYPSILDEVEQFGERLKHGDRPGARLSGLGKIAYKARLPNRSARRGKRGGFRLIYCDLSGKIVILLIIFSKTERSDIPTEVIRRMIAELNQ